MVSLETKTLYGDRNSLIFREDKHQYLIQAVSVTRIVAKMLGKEITPAIRLMPHFKAATAVGNQVHDSIAKLIHKQTPVGLEGKAEELVNTFKKAILKKLELSEMLAEEALGGVYQNIIIAGTIDAYCGKTQTLYEGKTTSADKGDEWLGQTRIYQRLLFDAGFLVKTIKIVNLRTKHARSFTAKHLRTEEIDMVVKAAKLLIDEENNGR